MYSFSLRLFLLYVEFESESKKLSDVENRHGEREVVSYYAPSANRLSLSSLEVFSIFHCLSLDLEKLNSFGSESSKKALLASVLWLLFLSLLWFQAMNTFFFPQQKNPSRKNSFPQSFSSLEFKVKGKRG